MRLAQHSITSGHTPRPMPSISAQRVTDTSLPANLLIPAHPSSCVQTVLCHPRPPPPVPPAVSSTLGMSLSLEIRTQGGQTRPTTALWSCMMA